MWWAQALPEILMQSTKHRAFLPAIWGLLFAGATIVVHVFLGRDASVLVASLLLAMIGAIYVGFGLIDGRPKTIVIECIGALVFAAAAICGMLVSPWFIVAAIGGHAGWDFLHHNSGHRTTSLAKTPRWYLPYCAVYDLCAAVGLAALWFSRGVMSV
jgi:hypothetical protein